MTTPIKRSRLRSPKRGFADYSNGPFFSGNGQRGTQITPKVSGDDRDGPGYGGHHPSHQHQTIHANRTFVGGGRVQVNVEQQRTQKSRPRAHYGFYQGVYAGDDAPIKGRTEQNDDIDRGGSRHGINADRSSQDKERTERNDAVDGGRSRHGINAGRPGPDRSPSGHHGSGEHHWNGNREHHTEQNDDVDGGGGSRHRIEAGRPGPDRGRTEQNDAIDGVESRHGTNAGRYVPDRSLPGHRGSGEHHWNGKQEHRHRTVIGTSERFGEGQERSAPSNSSTDRSDSDDKGRKEGLSSQKLIGRAESDLHNSNAALAKGRNQQKSGTNGEWYRGMEAGLSSLEPPNAATNRSARDPQYYDGDDGGSQRRTRAGRSSFEPPDAVVNRPVRAHLGSSEHNWTGGSLGHRLNAVEDGRSGEKRFAEESGEGRSAASTNVMYEGVYDSDESAKWRAHQNDGVDYGRSQHGTTAGRSGFEPSDSAAANDSNRDQFNSDEINWKSHQEYHPTAVRRNEAFVEGRYNSSQSNPSMGRDDLESWHSNSFTSQSQTTQRTELGSMHTNGAVLTTVRTQENGGVDRGPQHGIGAVRSSFEPPEPPGRSRQVSGEHNSWNTSREHPPTRGGDNNGDDGPAQPRNITSEAKRPTRSDTLSTSSSVVSRDMDRGEEDPVVPPPPPMTPLRQRAPPSLFLPTVGEGRSEGVAEERGEGSAPPRTTMSHNDDPEMYRDMNRFRQKRETREATAGSASHMNDRYGYETMDNFRQFSSIYAREKTIGVKGSLGESLELGPQGNEGSKMALEPARNERDASFGADRMETGHRDDLASQKVTQRTELSPLGKRERNIGVKGSYVESLELGPRGEEGSEMALEPSRYSDSQDRAMRHFTGDGDPNHAPHQFDCSDQDSMRPYQESNESNPPREQTKSRWDSDNTKPPNSHDDGCQDSSKFETKKNAQERPLPDNTSAKKRRWVPMIVPFRTGRRSEDDSEDCVGPVSLKDHRGDDEEFRKERNTSVQHARQEAARSRNGSPDDYSDCATDGNDNNPGDASSFPPRAGSLRKGTFHSREIVPNLKFQFRIDHRAEMREDFSSVVGKDGTNFIGPPT